jgi:drug/metabolite transporter (DMT)-like permease
MVGSRFCIGQFEPFTFISLRLLMASTGYLTVYCFQSGQKSFPRDLRLWRTAGIYGLLGIALPMSGFVNSLQYQSSGMVSLFQSIGPALTVLLAHFLLNDERLNWSKIVGIVIAFAGASALFLTGETGLADLTQADWRGYAWLGLAILSVAAAGIYGRTYLQDADNFDVATINMLVSAAVITGIVLATGGYDLSRVRLSGILVLLYSAIVGGFFAFLLNFFILKRFGATAQSESTYVTPVIATTLGAILLGEIITPVMILGMALIITGLILLNRSPKKAVA